MPHATRVLDPEPVADFEAYLEGGGARALAAAAEVDPDDLTATVEAAGLRGRGGAGFPTGIKWRTVAAHRSPERPAVIVNAAEGEPGTFKDRAILRSNPYRVVEGALIAARAVGAGEVVVAIKSSFATEIERVRDAIEQFGARGLVDIECRIVEGPSAYLFGEESALLEVVEGRHPFPRVTPPYRRGIDDADSGSGNAASWGGLAGAGELGDAPALVDNVETLANVPDIVLEGPDWFRSVGTEASPGTIVCTVVGATERHGVGEFAMGTPLWEVIDSVGGGPQAGRTLVAAISGTANAVLPADRFDTPLTYEAMAAAGSGLGTGGFIVFDDQTDLVAVAQGIARFLAVESCGQCTPCKDDGLAIAGHLDDIRRSDATPRDVAAIEHRLTTVADGARCALAAQHQLAVGSLVELARHTVRGHVDGHIDLAAPFLVAPLVDIVDGRGQVDEQQLDKQPDWSTDGTDSGVSPVDRYGGGPVEVAVGSSAGQGRAAGAAEAADGSDRRDPFATVRRHHHRLRADLDAVAAAGEPERGTALATLDRDVRRYLDLTGRVLYPTLSQATFSRGDDLAWAAEHDATRAARLSERLRSGRPGAASSTGSTAREDDGAFEPMVDELLTELAEMVRRDEEIAFPLLADRLDAARLADLADALAEVDAEPVDGEPVDRDPAAGFGTSPGRT